MNMCEYVDRWNLINNKFNEWFMGQTWKKQEVYLRYLIQKELKVSGKHLSEIFTTFNDIYPDGDGFSFDWEKYQLPTLMGITARYLKKYT